MEKVENKGNTKDKISKNSEQIQKNVNKVNSTKIANNVNKNTINKVNNNVSKSNIGTVKNATKNNSINKSKNMIEKENENVVIAKNKANINNTKIEQETKIYDFRKELNEQKNKTINKEVNSNQNNKIENKNINSINKNNPNKIQNNANKEIVKQAEKIVKAASVEDNISKNNSAKKSTNKKKRKGLFIALIIVLISLALVVLSTIFALLNKNNDKIIQGVYINNIDVSDLTKEEAIKKVEAELNSNETNYITVKYKDITKEIRLADINGKFDVKDAVEVAHKTGRDNNLVHNNYKILYSLILKNNLDITFTYDEELLQKQIDLVSLDLPGVAIDSSYVIDGNNLIIKNSKDGIRIKKSDFTKNLINSFKTENKSFEIPVEQCERKEIDIEEIHGEVYKYAKNATYTTVPYQIFVEEDGLDFAISVDEAKEMLLEDKEEYTIPLKVLKPEITVSELEAEAFPDVLATFTTKYGTADVNRNANIALAAKSINSVVLMPGEVFSYNDLIGECSTRTGYKESTIYLNGELAKGVGGGICQVSTTLYNAVLRANLEIVQRRNHSLSVTYVPLGQDAMVSIGSQDFQFKNNRNYPVKVVATTGPGSITCKIMGLKQETEYEVKLYSRVISKTETKTKVETYKLLYLNGKEVSRTWLSTDTYKNH